MDDPKTDEAHPGDPLHGVTLKALLTALVETYEWAGLAQRIDLACFRNEPSVASSLRFLRRTPWARAKVEALWVADARKAERNRLRNQRRAARRAIAAQHAAAEADDQREAVSPSAPAAAGASKSEPPPHS